MKIKKFLFDTWHGAFCVLCGATAFFFAMSAAHRFLGWSWMENAKQR